MIKRIAIFNQYPFYDATRHFSSKFAEALARKNFEVVVVDMTIEEVFKRTLTWLGRTRWADLTCSFTPMKLENISEHTHTPHWSILVDPACYASLLFKDKSAIISCVDKNECQFVRSTFECKKAFFFSHAVEKDLSFAPDQPRPYDVVFIGSCFEHEEIREDWKNKTNPKMLKVFDTAVEIILGDNHTSLVSGVESALASQGLEPAHIYSENLIYYVDKYLRGRDRVEMLRSIKNAHVHVFGGGANPLMKTKVKGWSHYLSGKSNIHIHAAIPFSESFEILKQSKISLNCMPFFKNGTHERIFTGFASGAMPVTTDNIWVRENFVEGEELLLYQPFHWDKIDDKIGEFLRDENKRQLAVQKGREKVMQDHTWDNRAEQFLQEM